MKITLITSNPFNINLFQFKLKNNTGNTLIKNYTKFKIIDNLIDSHIFASMSKFFKFICILTLHFILSQNLYAQQHTETIYLKNGSIIKGNIVEFVPNATYTIVTPDGNKFVFNIADIEKIAYSIPNNNPSKNQGNTSNSEKDKLYFTQIQAGYGASSGSLGLNSFNLSVTETGKWAEIIEVGGGIGFSRYFDVDVNMLPIFASAKINFNKSEKVRPYVAFDGGYSLNLSDGIENSGIYIHPTLGIQMPAGNNQIRVSFGYQMQQMPFYTIEGWWVKKQFLYAEAIKINVAYTF